VSVVWKRSLPDPDEPLREWEAFAFDTFRIRDGQLVEHWDETTR
jgi:predicted SnoaL-like aldol condensation-catalyzing enzyme